MDKITHPTLFTDIPLIPASLCIVTNKLDNKLLEIILLCAPLFTEILIGFDGEKSSIPVAFQEMPGNVHIKTVTWQGYSMTKNNLAAMAKSDWILSLDGDEMPDELLIKKVYDLLSGNPSERVIAGFKRISFFEGKKILHGAWRNDKVWRLYHKKNTAWKQDLVHEQLEAQQIPERVLLKGILYHYTADDAVAFLEKNKKYARLSAEKYFAKGKKSLSWKRWLSPAFTFVKEYIFQLGLLDGKAGWKIAQINARYTYWKYNYLKAKYQESKTSS